MPAAITMVKARAKRKAIGNVSGTDAQPADLKFSVLDFVAYQVEFGNLVDSHKEVDPGFFVKVDAFGLTVE